MKKTAILLGIGLCVMIGLVSLAGSAFGKLEASVNTENGFAGSAYVAKADK